MVASVLLPEGRAREASQDVGAEHGPGQGLATLRQEAQAVCRAAPDLSPGSGNGASGPGRTSRPAAPVRLKEPCARAVPALAILTIVEPDALRATPRSTLKAGAERLRPEGAGSLTTISFAHRPPKPAPHTLPPHPERPVQPTLPTQTPSS